MGIDTCATGGFGYQIDPDECQRLEAVYGEPVEELIDTHGAMGLPPGFYYSHYNDGYGEPHGVTISVNDAVSAKALRGEAPSPDFSALLVWKAKYLIKFTRDAPDLYFCTYTS